MNSTYNISNETSEKIYPINKNPIERVRNLLNRVGNLAGKPCRWLNQATQGHLLKATTFGVPACVCSLLSLTFAVKAAVATVAGTKGVFITLGLAPVLGPPLAILFIGLPIVVPACVNAAADVLISYGLFRLAIYCGERAVNF